MAELEGFDELEKQLEKLINETDIAIDEALEETCTEIIAETKLRTPVDTGNLRRSWTHDSVVKDGNKSSIELGSSVAYAQAVEEGHRQGSGFVQGRFMLKDSIDVYGNAKLQKKIDDKLKKAGW